MFVHRSFPGQFLHLVRSLVGATNQVVFVTEPGPLEIPGVTKVVYRINPASRRTHPAAQEHDMAQRRAQAVAEVASGLRIAGFSPDIVIGHEAWGEMLDLDDVWPGVPTITYREYFYHLEGADVGFDAEFPLAAAQRPAVRGKNAVGLLSLAAGGQGITPTRWQRSLYPSWAQSRIAVVADGIDLEACHPNPAQRTEIFALGRIQVRPDERLLTFVSRHLEPYRGFHTLMRALPHVMARPDTQVVCVGGDSVSYGLMPPQGTWRQRLLAEIGSAVDPARLHFPGQIGYADYRRLLQRSDVHTYLSYPFIPSWSLREALASGCAVVAGDTAPVREFIEDGVNGALVPCLDPAAVAGRITDLLADASQRNALGQAARARAEREMQLSDHLAGWRNLILQTIGAAA
jgi:glycosyltransferase involved in cell wall biosynthesis